MAQWLVSQTWDLKVESSSPGRCTLTVPLSTQLYKWEPASFFGAQPDKRREVTCDGLVSHAGRVEILLVASYNRNQR